MVENTLFADQINALFLRLAHALFRDCLHRRRRSFNLTKKTETLTIPVEVEGFWCALRSSKPLWGVRSFPGEFDSHMLPPM